MRVGLDITQAVKKKGRGIARYILEIVPRLADPALGLEPSLWIRGERWWRRDLVAGLAPDLRRRWQPLSVWMNGSGLDWYHGFGNHLPAFSGIPLSFTVHDFRALDRRSGSALGGDRLRRNIERATGIICLTDHGRQRLLHHYPDFPTGRVAVVPHGVDGDRFRPQDPQRARDAARQRGLERPFFVQLGSWFPHKNLELSIRAFARTRARREGLELAFIGGGASPEYARRLASIATEEGVAESLHWIEDVPDTEVPLILGAATALLQPSRYEGFALPLLEAMAVGLPGVVSDSSCLPEVSGGIWPIAGEDDVAGFAAGMDRMSLEEDERARAIREGLERAAGFTWEEAARRTAAFFRQQCAAAASG